MAKKKVELDDKELKLYLDKSLKLKEQIDLLTVKYKDINDSIKETMKQRKLDNLNMNGFRFYFKESFRNKITDEMKCMKLLLSKGKKNCVDVTYKVNIQSLEDEILLGNLNKDEFEPYVKKSTVRTFTIEKE